MQDKGIRSIFKKVRAGNFHNVGKCMSFQVQEAFRTLNRQDQNKTSPCHNIVKTLSSQNKERLLKVARKKCQVTYKGKEKRITADFSKETLEGRRV
jgi:hypothetical protein